MVLNKPTRVLIAFTFLVVITILFWLPGSAFPKQTWFKKIYLDKWIHVGIFAIAAFLWLRALEIRKRKHIIFLILVLSFYGFVIEAVQGLYIINRSFDLMDLLCNVAGIIAAVIFVRGYIKK